MPRQVKQGEGYVSMINQCHLQHRLRVCPHHTLYMPVMRRSFSHCHWELDLPRKTVPTLTCPVASLPCRAEDTVLSHHEPTNSHHNVCQFYIHTPHQTRRSLSSHQVKLIFFSMLQQRKENSGLCRIAESPPSLGWGGRDCCSLLRTPPEPHCS